MTLDTTIMCRCGDERCPLETPHSDYTRALAEKEAIRDESSNVVGFPAESEYMKARFVEFGPTIGETRALLIANLRRAEAQLEDTRTIHFSAALSEDPRINYWARLEIQRAEALVNGYRNSIAEIDRGVERLHIRKLRYQGGEQRERARLEEIRHRAQLAAQRARARACRPRILTNRNVRARRAQRTTAQKIAAKATADPDGPARRRLHPRSEVQP